MDILQVNCKMPSSPYTRMFLLHRANWNYAALLSEIHELMPNFHGNIRWIDFNQNR